MSHWPADSGSPRGSAAAWTVPGALITGPRSDSNRREAGVFGTAPIARLAAAPATARVRAARVANRRERETTVARPMRRFSRTTRPPARWIARTNWAWLVPRAERTTYVGAAPAAGAAARVAVTAASATAGTFLMPFSSFVRERAEATQSGFAQQRATDLPARRLGHIGGEADAPRVLVGRGRRLDVVLQLAGEGIAGV